MTVMEKLAGLVGLGGYRNDDPPRYRAIAPGLIVTDTEAWAWYEIDTANTDLLGETGRDAEQDLAEAALRTLVGRECQLRVLWGRIDGNTYLHGLGLEPARETPPEHGVSEHAVEWAAIRADDIDDLVLPDRRVLLGVKIADRTPSEAGQALGLSSPHLARDDLARYSATAVQLGGPLRATAWRVRLASTELLAWSISRELHRSTTLPLEDTITGAPLARLASGRVEFGPDHFVVLDGRGAGACYGTVLALSDFPEVMVTPGQEWLALLGMVETSPLDAEATAGGPVLVLPEASVRFTVPSFRASRKAVGEARRLAKEQRQSAAKTSAGEPEESILTAEDELRSIEFSLSRRHTVLVNDHPRIVVTGRSRAELDAKVTALIGAYDEIGVTAVVMVDEQREGWLETLPCDRVRVPDLGHWRDATALVQSWFWGGSRVGSTDPRVPAIGYTTGSTSGLVRYLATEAVTHSDAPVTALTGRTRRGKTTLMQLACLDVCLSPVTADAEPWVVLVDFKGDADGVVAAARQYGIAADLIEVGPAYAGVLDAFATSDPEHAVDNVVGMLALCLPRHLADQSTSLLQRAVAQIHAHPGATTWKVVEHLVQVGSNSIEGSLIREVAVTLRATTASGFGRLVAGRPADDIQVALPTRSGLTVLQLPGVNLPEADTPEDRWTPAQRASVAALRGVLGWCTTMAGSRDMRPRAKLLAFPEVHLLTATVDGRVYLTRAARMGAAFGLSLMLDTQDVTGLTSLSGLIESVSAVFGFAQQTAQEQRALAELVGLADDEDTRQVIDALDRSVAGGPMAGDQITHEIRRGHSLFRDRQGRVATVQVTIPTDELRITLDTSAQASAARYVADASRQIFPEVSPASIPEAITQAAHGEASTVEEPGRR